MSAKKTVLTREDREKNRQVLLQEMDAACQAEREERQREAQKKLDCRSELLGQIDYNERMKHEQKQEEARMVDKQNESKKLLDEEIKYLLDHPQNLKWNPRRKTLPEELHLPCS